MKEWKDFTLILARKLTPVLAFGILVILLLAWYGDQIPDAYRLLIYLVVIGGMIIYSIQAVLVEWRRRSETSLTRITEPRGPVVVGNVKQITYIVNQVEPKASLEIKEQLERQLSQYLLDIQERTGKIILRGIERGERQVIELDLDQVYVPLQAVYDELRDVKPRQDDELAPSDPDIPVETDEARTKEIQLNEISRLGRRIILTGGPGCGKTTVLQHVAWTLATAILENNTNLARLKLSIDAPAPLPIYVPLSLYAIHLRDLPKNAPVNRKTLLAYISEYLVQRQTLLDLNADFFASLLHQGSSVILLLDGLDEVPDDDLRERVRQAIEDLAILQKELRIIVTSRTVAYRGGAVFGYGFRQVRVQPLEDENIRTLVKHAYLAIFSKNPKKAGDQAGLLQKGIDKLESDRKQRLGEDTPRLVDSPLMVRMLIIVRQNKGELPEQRAELYQKTVDVILLPDYNPDIDVAQDIGRRVGESPKIHRGMLRKLAFHMHQQGRDQGRDIDESSLKAVFTGDAAYEPYVESLLALTRQRGALLEERDRRYRFLHHTFQEYLVAEYLAEVVHETDRIAEFLESSAILDSWWREPVLLLVGYLDVNDPPRGRTFLQRLARLEARSEFIVLTDGNLQLAAAEAASIGYLECRFQLPDLHLALSNRLEDLTMKTDWTIFPQPVWRAIVADALDRFGYLPMNLDEFARIEPDGSPAVDYPFYLGRYPVTNLQYARFLRPENFQDRELWINFPKYDFPQEDGRCPQIGDWGDEAWNWLQKRLAGLPAGAPKIIYPSYWNDPRFGISRKGVPVVGVTWYEANAYCRWLECHWSEREEGQANHWPAPSQVRLPLEPEWELAAGGVIPDGRYPWDASGQATTDMGQILQCANVSESEINRTTPVGMYPLGCRQPHGLWDMSGNVWEWQANYADKDHDVLRLRGGAWFDLSDFARAAFRNYLSPGDVWLVSGFRVAAFPS